MFQLQPISSLVGLTAIALSCSLASAQSFNVHLGPAANPGPSSTYGAGALSPGVWNAPDPLNPSTPLVDLAGNATTVTFEAPTQGAITGADPCLTGDDEAFLQNFVDPVAPGEYQFTGLMNGDYTVYSYCLATDNAIYTTDVDVVGAFEGWQTIGGLDWCTVGDFTSPEIYAFHTVTVTNGTITIMFDAGATSFETFNGFQIVMEGDAAISTFCDPNLANSTGSPTALSGVLGTGVESGLRLNASAGVPSEFGYFLVSAGMADPGIMLSNGNFCLLDGVNPFGRYNFGTVTNSVGAFDAAGDFQNLVGTATSNGGFGFDVPNQIPLPGGAMIMSGETWNFQLWHRDTPSGAGTSTFSNGVSVTFP